MKKLNVPFLLFLVIGFMVLVVGTHFLHGYQVARNAKNLRERAQRAQEAGDIDEQIRILQRYMRYEPEDTEQLKILLAASRDRTLSAETINLQELFKQFNALEKAIRKNPDDVELRRLGLDFALHRNVMRIPDAMSHLKSIQAAGELTNKDKVIFAQCLEATSKKDEAIATLCEMIGYDRSSGSFSEDVGTATDEISAYIALLMMLERQSSVELDPQVSLTILDRMIEKNPESAAAYLRRATFYQSNEEIPDSEAKALADVNKAMELNAGESESTISIVLNAAGLLMRLDQMDRANAILNKALEEHPEDRRVYMALAEVKEREGNKQAALEIVQEGLEKLKLNPELVHLRASLELDLGNVADCRDGIERLTEQRFDPMRVDLLRARVLMKENDFRGAEKLLLKLRSRGRHSDRFAARIDSLLMTAYKRLGKNDKVTQIADRMGETSSSAKFELARSLFAQGRYDEALEHLSEISKKPEDLTPEGKMFVYRMTMDCLIGKEQRKPKSAQDWTRIDDMAKTWVTKQKYNEVQQLQFEIDFLRRKGMLSEARSLAERAVQQNRRNAQLWMLLNTLTTDNEQGMSILNQVESIFGDSWALRAARADRIVRSGADDADVQLKGLLEGLDAFSGKDQVLLKSVVANSFIRLEEYDQAIELLQQLSANDPSNLTIKTMIFDLALKAGNVTLMDELLAELAVTPGKTSTEYRIAEANRLLWRYENGEQDEGALEDAWDLVEKAREDRPEWSPIYELRADILSKKGNHEAAASSLEEALEKRPGHVQCIKKLANVYKVLGRNSEAAMLMSRLPDSEKSRIDLVNDLRRIAANDPKAALVRAKSLISADTNNALDLILLADVQALAGEEAAALKTLKRATTVDPNVPQVWSRTVRFLMERDRDAEAEAVIRDLQLKVTDETLPLILGQCQALLGNYEAAVAAYEEGLKSNPNDDMLLRNLVLVYQAADDDTKKLETLDKIIASQNASTNWARRTKAMSVASSNAYKDFLTALELIEQNADQDGQLQGEDLQLWLQLCGSRPEAVSRDRAAQRLMEIQQRRRLSVPERAILASIYKANGRWGDAK